MKSLALAAALLASAAFLPGSPAHAAGCVRGAVVGGVAGHFVHRHGLIGAGIGCAIGHHEAARRDREERDMGYYRRY